MLLFRQVFEDASFKRVGIGVGVGVNVDVDVDKGVFPNHRGIDCSCERGCEGLRHGF